MDGHLEKLATLIEKVEGLANRLDRHERHCAARNAMVLTGGVSVIGFLFAKVMGWV